MGGCLGCGGEGGRGEEGEKEGKKGKSPKLVVCIAKNLTMPGGGGLRTSSRFGTIGLIKAINTFRADKKIRKLATYVPLHRKREF